MPLEYRVTVPIRTEDFAALLASSGIRRPTADLPLVMANGFAITSGIVSHGLINQSWYYHLRVGFESAENGWIIKKQALGGACQNP